MLREINRSEKKEFLGRKGKNIQFFTRTLLIDFSAFFSPFIALIAQAFLFYCFLLLLVLKLFIFGFLVLLHCLLPFLFSSCLSY